MSAGRGGGRSVPRARIGAGRLAGCGGGGGKVVANEWDSKGEEEDRGGGWSCDPQPGAGSGDGAQAAPCDPGREETIGNSPRGVLGGRGAIRGPCEVPCCFRVTAACPEPGEPHLRAAEGESAPACAADCRSLCLPVGLSGEPRTAVCTPNGNIRRNIFVLWNFRLGFASILLSLQQISGLLGRLRSRPRGELGKDQGNVTDLHANSQATAVPCPHSSAIVNSPSQVF